MVAVGSVMATCLVMVTFALARSPIGVTCRDVVVVNCPTVVVVEPSLGAVVVDVLASADVIVACGSLFDPHALTTHMDAINAANPATRRRL